VHPYCIRAHTHKHQGHVGEGVNVHAMPYISGAESGDAVTCVTKQVRVAGPPRHEVTRRFSVKSVKSAIFTLSRHHIDPDRPEAALRGWFRVTTRSRSRWRSQDHHHTIVCTHAQIAYLLVRKGQGDHISHHLSRNHAKYFLHHCRVSPHTAHTQMHGHA
jgi:hypothetical protein